MHYHKHVISEVSILYLLNTHRPVKCLHQTEGVLMKLSAIEIVLSISNANMKSFPEGDTISLKKENQSKQMHISQTRKTNCK